MVGARIRVDYWVELVGWRRSGCNGGIRGRHSYERDNFVVGFDRRDSA
jgi:hypothetical protein